MSSPDPNEAIRQAARDVLREVVPEIVRELTRRLRCRRPRQRQRPRETATATATAMGIHHTRTLARTWSYRRCPHRPSRPSFVHPPGTVLRPQGKSSAAPAEPGAERSAPPVQSPAPAVRYPAAPERAREPQRAISRDEARVETVKLDTDEDLERFIRDLMTRVENPRERLAIRRGQLRFLLRRSETVGHSQGALPVRVQKGAVTERVIRQAASAGTRLVLAPGAVLTPLARDHAKALGVQIERERKC